MSVHFRLSSTFLTIFATFSSSFTPLYNLQLITLSFLLNQIAFSLIRLSSIIQYALTQVHHYFCIVVFCVVFYCIGHVYPSFTRNRIVWLFFGRDVYTCLGVAISEVSKPPVFRIKVGRPVKCLAQGHNKQSCRLVLHNIH